jgi:aminoglycoside phosphotransferase (APT) family kinase protein
MFHSSLSSENASALLRAAGVAVSPGKLTLERRERRWLLTWPDSGHLAWLPADAEGALQLEHENRMLALVAKHCSFAAPRTLYFEPSNGLAIRTKLPGLVDGTRLHARLHAKPALAEQLGDWVGRALAQLHAIPSSSVTDWLPTRPNWPEPLAWIRERLPKVIGQHALLPRLNALLRHYEALMDRQRDPVPAHTDLGLHNLVVDPETFAPRGIIDFDASAYVDRHMDFRYCVLDVEDFTFFDHALKSYGHATGVMLERRTIFLHNALSACCYLANRLGQPADEPWCGRTLAEDMAWCDEALRRVGI